MRVLWLASFFLPLVLGSCPPSMALSYGGICTAVYARGASSTCNNFYNYAATNCASSHPGSIPVVILSEEDQNYWKSVRISSSYNLVLGIKCNANTSTWEWTDGSKMVYKPASYSEALTSTCQTTPIVWYMQQAGDWVSNSATGNCNVDVWCMARLPPIPAADDECDDFSDESDDDTCYQVGVKAETFIDSQTICKSFGANLASVHNSGENSYIRRMAVSRGLVNGVRIGGSSITGKTTDIAWIDGTTWDYNNFFPGFPVAGAGDCVALDTNNVGGQWVNVECADKMPYACVKKPHAAEPACADAIRTEGEIIYSPGFPSNSSSPCDFFLKVDPGKLVEVEILLLEANSCCDRLVLTEGSLGGVNIANLTGEVASGTKYITKTSNIMRASWQPQGAVNVRGMMITFRGV